MTIRIEHGDCREVIKTVPENSIDAIITDPPYHLVAMTKRFGAAGAKPAISSDHQRIARGFMQTEWDGSGIAFNPETWAALLPPLRPGAFLLAFGGARTYHRLACAVEDAGFVIQDCVMWMFGQGWPKRRDMLKPAYEPVVMAYKPGGPRYLNIAGCRVAVDDDDYERNCSGDRGHSNNRKRQTDFGQTAGHASNIGRWPSNIILDGSGDVLDSFDAVGARASGTGAVKRASGSGYQANAFGVENRPPGTPNIEYGDSGSVARFFWHAKAGPQDRWGSRHPTVKPVELIRYLMRLITPPRGRILDPFAGSGTAGVAALAEGFDAILIEREDSYVADIRERMAFYEGGGKHSVVAKNRNRPDPTGTLL